MLHVYDLMHVVMWTELHLPMMPLPMSTEQVAKGCVGFIPVFDTVEHAHEWGESQVSEEEK